MVLGFVLAGGQSSRMGEDKAFLVLGGRPLIALALEKAAAVCDEVRIVGAPAKFAALGVPAVEDIYPGAGPLAGIHAALASSPAELNLVIGVDTPFLVPEFLRFLLGEAGRTGAVVTSPRVGGHFEPLCAVYRRGFAAVAEQALRAGDFRIAPLFATVPCHAVEESAIERFELGAAMFDNLNTPAEFQRAQALRPR
jgi:molybdopterin-guanine dinucleotide biosynthesis protein A